MAHETFRTRRPALFAATAMIAFGLMGGTPARALDDGQENIFDSLLGLVKMGIGFEDDDVKPSIDYRERPPLVVPPKMELRQPMQPVGQRNAAWPVDQDLAKQRQAAAAAARPRGNNVDADPLPARDLQRYGRIAGRNAEAARPTATCSAIRMNTGQRPRTFAAQPIRRRILWLAQSLSARTCLTRRPAIVAPQRA